MLGLRLVKKTVNFDDPGTYHFYYGDETGRPGRSSPSFPGSTPRPAGSASARRMATAFRVPEGSIGYWTHRFLEKGVAHEAIAKRFGETVLSFKDPDGMRLRSSAMRDAGNEPAWSGGDVPAEHAIRGFHGVTPASAGSGTDGRHPHRRVRLRRGRARGVRLSGTRPTDASIGGIVDIHAAGDFLRGRQGGRLGPPRRLPRGRRRSAVRDGAASSPTTTASGPRSRKTGNYFRSLYFREPGGVLFEIATDDPGLRRRRAGRLARPVAEAAAAVRGETGSDRSCPARPLGQRLTAALRSWMAEMPARRRSHSVLQSPRR